eukprot:TRINITY_DN5539_c0_g2_i1.p2 TRINITY_DN5539_c0_g2~~TRINITY_DN5539_c0_g2_i1.p2  ORF type:complete len:197 (+),score=-19.17 TRINITY_DN5539_c0_g2_i1:69-593(+)
MYQDSSHNDQFHSFIQCLTVLQNCFIIQKQPHNTQNTKFLYHRLRFLYQNQISPKLKYLTLFRWIFKIFNFYPPKLFLPIMGHACNTKLLIPDSTNSTLLRIFVQIICINHNDNSNVLLQSQSTYKKQQIKQQRQCNNITITSNIIQFPVFNKTLFMQISQTAITCDRGMLCIH